MAYPTTWQTCRIFEASSFLCALRRFLCRKVKDSLKAVTQGGFILGLHAGAVRRNSPLKCFFNAATNAAEEETQ